MERKRLRVAVMFGGRSAEHDVSVTSARAVIAALDPEKYEVVPIGITREGHWLIGGDPLNQLREGRPAAAESLSLVAPEPTSGKLTAIAIADNRTPSAANARVDQIDVVFPILHGPYGEDGTVQGLLELANVPYVGAGVLGSACGMDKAVMKTLFEAAGLPLLPYMLLRKHDWRRRASELIEATEQRTGYPCFVKPANLGSSVGVSKARDRSELVQAVDLAFAYDVKVVVEQAAEDCREVECAVLGNHEPVASVVGEIRPRREFYDYTAKYISDDTDLLIPAPLPPAVAEQIRSLAIVAFQAVECAGLARVDFFVGRGDETIYVNEINTLPGFTPISMYPKLWEATGLSYRELVDRLIELALERHAERQELRIS